MSDQERFKISRADMKKAEPGDIIHTFMESAGAISFAFDPYEFLCLATGYKYDDFRLLALYPNYPTHYLYTAPFAEDTFCGFEPVTKLDGYDKYFGKYCRWLDRERIHKVTKKGPDGILCKDCKEFYPMAVANQPDQSLICYSCRFNPMRKYY